MNASVRNISHETSTCAFAVLLVCPFVPHSAVHAHMLCVTKRSACSYSAAHSFHPLPASTVATGRDPSGVRVPQSAAV